MSHITLHIDSYRIKTSTVRPQFYMQRFYIKSILYKENENPDFLPIVFMLKNFDYIYIL